jgi:hypothetical protein
VTDAAKRDNPALSPAQAFEKVYTDPSDAGVVLRRAFTVVRNAAFQDDDDDSDVAYAALQKIGDTKYPTLTSAQRFAKAFEENLDLAARAHKRPSNFSTSYPHPTRKAMPLVNVDGVTLKPTTSTETNVDDPAEALAQLRALGRQRWPSLSEAEAFIRALSDPENRDLVNLALSTPKGSSPARQ